MPNKNYFKFYIVSLIGLVVCGMIFSLYYSSRPSSPADNPSTNNTPQTNQEERAQNIHGSSASQETPKTSFSSTKILLTILAIGIVTVCVVEVYRRNKKLTNALNLLDQIIKGRQLSYHKADSSKIKVIKGLFSSDFTGLLPYNAKSRWEKFSKEQKSITLDIKLMYTDYKELKSLFFLKKPTNLLNLETILAQFPNVETIICKNTDSASEEDDDYSTAIVNKDFISSLQEYLQNNTKKLKKIIIQTHQEEIEYYLDSSSIKNTQWYIGKGKKTIVYTKTPYDDCIAKISSMIKGETPSYEVTSLDKAMFAALVKNTIGPSDNKIKSLPYTQQDWDTFRNEQTRITLYIPYMYTYYKAFMPHLLIENKPKNLLKVDNIVTIFPNVETIICTRTDRDGEKDDYSPAIVDNNFILELQKFLKQDTKQLKKIIIQTHQENSIAWNLDIGYIKKNKWHIGKGKKTIVYTKTPYIHCIATVLLMLDGMIGANPSYDEVTSLDKAMFAALVKNKIHPPADNIQIPPEIQQIANTKQEVWNIFRDVPRRITLYIPYMYTYYKAFMPHLLIENKPKNLLKVDNIVTIFPNVETIICKDTDRASAEGDYSTDIVNNNFILELQKYLKQDTKQLKKIIIQTSQKNSIAWNLDTNYIQENKWYIGKGKKTIVCTTTPYDDCISKISSMIKGETPSYEVTSLDAAMFVALVSNQVSLSVNNIKIPSYIQQITNLNTKKWNTFSHPQKDITLNMDYMYSDYEAFRKILFSIKPTNLLQVDTIVTLFPMVETITCTNMDRDRGHNGGYGPYIVNATLIARINRMLEDAQPQKLKKITLSTLLNPITKDMRLKAKKRLTASGWEITQERYGLHNILYGFFAPKNFQISITKS